MMQVEIARQSRLEGVLLGTALGDALGLPAEGLSARTIARRFGTVDRFRLLGNTGFVSDDTEQAALVAQSLARYSDDVDACRRAFRKSLLGWFFRLPFGVGRATIRACLKIAVGRPKSGVKSAGNGSAMRAAVIGAYFYDQPEKRLQFGRALADVTHTDDRAVEGSLFVAELAAACANSDPDASRVLLVESARKVVRNPLLGAAIDEAIGLARIGASVGGAAAACGTTGYVVHTLAFATFCFLRFGDEPLNALRRAISAGGDTDSIAAILGGWLGILHGSEGLSDDLLARIHDGPFGPTHLRALARSLVQGDAPPRYSVVAAFGRNLGISLVVLGHVLIRAWPR